MPVDTIIMLLILSLIIFCLQGAGDAFVGALANFLISHKNHPMEEIVAAACYIATMSVTKEGTQTSYPTMSEHNVFLKSRMQIVNL